jgi:hypothetical protein
MIIRREERKTSPNQPLEAIAYAPCELGVVYHAVLIGFIAFLWLLSYPDAITGK